MKQRPAYTVQAFGLKRSFGRGGNTVHVLNDVNLRVRPGQMIALYGPSGSGKTTLLNLIGALDHPTDGKLAVCHKNLLTMSEAQRAQFRRTTIGFIFQNYTLLPTYTAHENVDLALRLSGLSHGERNRRAEATLAAVGLPAWSDHKPDELSGGQRQRVAIARALALQPALILADEPTSGLDTRTTRRILSLFRGIAAQQGTTFLIVSHDPLIVNFVDHAYDLKEGRLVPRTPHHHNGNQHNVH